jgi:lysine 2,3-aminomutase
LIGEKGDEIWNQCVPRIEEITDTRGEEDPLHEEDSKSGIPFLTHRYPDRVLMIVSNSCAMYCRFCTRKRKVGDNRKNPTKQDIDRMIDYIKEHKEVRDVILSGGDPLLLSDEKLEWILEELRKIKHIEMIRIGTRVPCTFPQRITGELCEMLKKYNKSPALYINTHFEHPFELTKESIKACEMLADAGIPLGNQSVVLKGVNNNPIEMKKLMQGLLKMKVKPYYIYQPDLVKGTYHFIEPVSKGLEIIKGLKGWTSGMAVPHFVIDTPGGKGKIALFPEMITINDNKIELINYKGEKAVYPKIEELG